jgi:hypothetical protein
MIGKHDGFPVPPDWYRLAVIAHAVALVPSQY